MEGITTMTSEVLLVGGRADGTVVTPDFYESGRGWMIVSGTDYYAIAILHDESGRKMFVHPCPRGWSASWTHMDWMTA